MIHTPTSRNDLCSLVLAGALLVWSAPALAQAPPNRPSDKAVADLIDQVEKARDKFEGSLDDAVKQSVLRSDKGEVHVASYLQDLQDNIKKAKTRHGNGYAASAEVEAVFKQCNAIDDYVKRTPTMTKGRSEWEQMAGALKDLAGAYGATFPLPPGATVRRMSDGETVEAVSALADAANQLKSEIGADKAVLKADQDAGKKLADDLSKSAKALKSRLADGKPSSAEARAVFDQMTKLNSFMSAHPTVQSASSAAGLTTALTKLNQSFGVSR